VVTPLARLAGRRNTRTVETLVWLRRRARCLRRGHLTYRRGGAHPLLVCARCGRRLQ
jgi:hypothetical protein